MTCCSFTGRAANGHLEVGQSYLQTQFKQWQQFSFMQEFPEVPVVVVLADTGTLGVFSADSDEPMAIRLRNVSTTGFQASMAEPSGSDGSILGETTFNYIAASVGVWQLNGSIFEAGLVQNTERLGAHCRPITFPNNGYTYVEFAYPFSIKPATLIDIQTSNNEERLVPNTGPSVPWLTPVLKNPNKAGIQVSMESGKTAGQGQQNLMPETMGYIAFEDGISSSFEVPSQGDLQVELYLTKTMCSPNTWMEVFTESGFRGCLREILTRPECSKQYFMLSKGNANCGCIAASTDCSQSSNQASSPYDLMAVRSSGDSGCLAVAATGCNLITDRSTCLTSSDGRALTWLEMTTSGRRCVWCSGPGCGNRRVCEPLDFLLYDGSFQATDEVASCNSPATELIPYLTRSDLEIDDNADFDGINWGDLTTWPSVTLSNSNLQAASPLVLASLNSRSGNGGWLRLRYSTVSATSVQFLNEESVYAVTAETFTERLATGPFIFVFGADGGNLSLPFTSVNLTNFTYTKSDGTVVIKDRVWLQLEVSCSQEECLDILSVGGAGAFWTVTQISGSFTTAVGAWQTVEVLLEDITYNGSISWDALNVLEVFSSVGNVDFQLRNLDIYYNGKTCNAQRNNQAERISLVAFDKAFHAEVGPGTSTVTTSSMTSSTGTSVSSTSTSASTSSTTRTSTSISNTSTSSSTSSGTDTSTFTTVTASSTFTTVTASSTFTTVTASSTFTTVTASSTFTTVTASSTFTVTASGTATSTSTAASLTSLSVTSTSRVDAISTTTSSSRTTTSSTMSSVTSVSVTETATAAPNLQAAILQELGQATDALLSELLSSNGTSEVAAAAATPLGTMAAVKLPEPAGFGIFNDNNFVPVIVEDSPAAAILPGEALELAAGSALVMTTFNAGNSSLGRGISASSNGQTLASVVDAVDISLVDLGDFSPRKVTVSTPIYIRLSSEVVAQPSVLCAFLDGDTWSQEGIRLASQEELKSFFGSSVNTTGLWCATTHLSIFSAFVDLLLDCTNVNVLSLDGLEEILRGAWWLRLPAVLLWLLLVVLLSLVVVGLFQDWKLYGSGMWKDEYFLTELPPMGRSCKALRAYFTRCHRESRQLVREISKEKSTESLSLQQLNAKLSDWMKSQNLQPALSDKMSEYIIAQNTLREVALQRNIHPRSMATHIWGPDGWVQGSLAISKSPVLKAMQLELEEGLPQAFVTVHSSRSRRVLSTWLAAHPVLELWQWDLHITAAKRAKIIMDCILGSLAFAALFLSVDGAAVSARSPESCPVQQGSVLWYAFVAIASMLLNLIPRGIIMYIGFRGFIQRSSRGKNWQLRLLAFKDAFFWALGVLVTAVHLLVITAFLANLGVVDEWKWLICFVVVLVRKMLVVPLLACLFSNLGTELAAWNRPSLVSQPPKTLGLDMDLLLGKALLEEESQNTSETWIQKVSELSERGVSIRQLLDFYADLGGTLMPHFDPEKSTTHDVVRQAIIPNSLHIRSWRSFMVLVHRGTGLAAMDLFSSDPYCVVRCVAGKSKMPKPWKGGGRTAVIRATRNPIWEEAFLVYEMSQDEALHFSMWDEDLLTKDDALGELCLPASEIWDGFQGDLQLQGPKSTTPILRISVTSYLESAEAEDAWGVFESARRAASKSSRLTNLGRMRERSKGSSASSGASGTPSRKKAAVEEKSPSEGLDQDPRLEQHHSESTWSPDDMHETYGHEILPSQRRFQSPLTEGTTFAVGNILMADLHSVGIRIVDETSEKTNLEDMEALSGPEVEGHAYASCVNMGEPKLAQKMVTHSWGNKFSFLIAAILADAVGSQLYDNVLDMLQKRQFVQLCDALTREMKLDASYWVCAFSVNQHAGICASPPPFDSTGQPIEACTCHTVKHLLGDCSEMNKFDHMMALLKYRLRKDFSEVRLEQVVAMEPDFSLLTRMWCIAELVEARKLHLHQSIMIHSAASRRDCLHRLFALDVREADASLPGDKELILNKISDVDAFNRQLKDLILHRMDTFLETYRGRVAASILDELVLTAFSVAV